MSSKRAKAKTKTTKKWPQWAISSVTVFDQSQIQEFKEVFNMIDQNRDGFIDKEELHDMTCSSSFIHEDHLQELLTTMGDQFTDEEVDEMCQEAPIDKKGNFSYVEFACIPKHGTKDEED
ncbi:myosin regulatory light polypeptide 9-like isoform X2 [Octodon degus]|uniref:Myosin regulatory light polypeptide 9-like isoform X2 n=1 Tax=Octodon degus TaxID=10160 RepID=A0A6P3F2U3_OCTDE|nr:myosin regulatory light polypeptide 9-like isoform X2 [Octodon degus]